ncbi:hypothetical protein C8R47DRAFT_1000321 [Mycena vitilis]|nr:hypothetical protein C8R47DRAFT_1000321 [Mycena vitilis]
MPEARECIATGKQTQEAFRLALANGDNLTLEAIAIDATNAEAARAGACSEAREGLVYDLDHNSTVKRGQNSHQTSVYPPILRSTVDHPQPQSLDTLVLTDVTYTSRAMILHFGDLYFMLQYLTHTNAQPYPRACWESSVRKVSKGVRGFKVGVAFIFPSMVIAFPSNDLVFQPTWATSLSELRIPPCVYPSPLDFLGLVAEWIEKLLLKPRHTRACDAIRDANFIFHGVGVYTVMELFFMAGLSPFLTLHEVFSNPSRAARFLMAFYTYVERSEQDIWALLQPCLHDGVLAPTRDQRLRYGDWLYVWAKDRTSLPTRMASLVDKFHAKLEALGDLGTIWGRDSTELFDVFEPTFIASGLQSVVNLGHLIFGQDAWIAAGGKRSRRDDPITALYRKYDLLSTPTMLESNIYRPLFLPKLEFRGKNSSHRPTFTFHGPKEIWSITRNFPSNSHWSSDRIIQQKKNTAPKSVREITGTDRHALLFKTIVTSSCGVSIGPLEHCGNGHVLHIGRSAVVAVCKGDPTIPEFHEKRALRGLDRISSHLDSNGKRKRGRSQKENNRLDKKISAINIGYERAGRGKEDFGEEGNQPAKPKKQRLNADQRLALDCIM